MGEAVMVRTIILDVDKNVTHRYDKYARRTDLEDVRWTHLKIEEDNVVDAVVDEMDQTEAFEEDLVEDQRPRITPFYSYTVVVIKAPTRRILTERDPDRGVVQISIIISRNKIISISSSDFDLIDMVMDSFQSMKLRMGSSTDVLSTLLDEIIEYSIDIIEEIEREIDRIEIGLADTSVDMGTVPSKVQNLREKLLAINKILRADLEVVREILQQESPHIETQRFKRHLEDRLLYAIDLVETERETLSGIMNLYLSALSNRMNENMYRLTLVGEALIVPTLVASIFGMNVELPRLGFWTIMLISVILSGVMLTILKVIRGF